ncbi:hypothetical protein RRG08_001599 [Elysia crispata]|uniref:Secreted protein n=1 Tax=Elysia crispata TaxID=231223 RepID=A0AAE1DZZ1_9GAST|nr:hypothetical protein RRG08_001599 [Elysia crispata]
MCPVSGLPRPLWPWPCFLMAVCTCDPCHLCLSNLPATTRTADRQTHRQDRAESWAAPLISACVRAGNLACEGRCGRVAFLAGNLKGPGNVQLCQSWSLGLEAEMSPRGASRSDRLLPGEPSLHREKGPSFTLRAPRALTACPNPFLSERVADSSPLSRE